MKLKKAKLCNMSRPLNPNNCMNVIRYFIFSRSIDPYLKIVKIKDLKVVFMMQVITRNLLSYFLNSIVQKNSFLN